MSENNMEKQFKETISNVKKIRLIVYLGSYPMVYFAPENQNILKRAKIIEEAVDFITKLMGEEK